MNRLSLIRIGLAIVVALLITSPVWAHTQQYADANATNPIRWPGASINVAFSASLSEQQANIKKGSDVAGALRRALKEWARFARIDFVEVSSENVNVSSGPGGGDGINLITVAATRENLALFRGASSSQPARTRIFFDESGNITEADIALNPSQKFSTDGTFGTYDLESTFVHEVGHLLGLDHSAVIGSVMQPRQAWNGTFYASQVAGRRLSSDDIAGVRALYGVKGLSRGLGAVSGTLTNPGGSPAAGIVVWAESVRDGRVIENVITRPGGAFRLNDIEAGSYMLYAAAADTQSSVTDLDSAHPIAANSVPRQMSANVHQLGRVEIGGEISVTFNAEIPIEADDFGLSLAGINNQASSVAVPLVPGNTYTLYAGGKNIQLVDLQPDRISVSSPGIHVDRATLSQESFGKGIEVISFQITIDPGTAAGNYSIWLAKKNGSMACLLGAVVVLAADQSALIPEVHSSGTDREAIAENESTTGGVGDWFRSGIRAESIGVSGVTDDSTPVTNIGKTSASQTVAVTRASLSWSFNVNSKSDEFDAGISWSFPINSKSGFPVGFVPCEPVENVPARSR